MMKLIENQSKKEPRGDLCKKGSTLGRLVGIIFVIGIIAIGCQKKQSGSSEQKTIPSATETANDINNEQNDDSPLLSPEMKGEKCTNSCVIGFLAHGNGLDVGEFAEFVPQTNRIETVVFRDGTEWADRFDEYFVTPYFTAAGLDIDNFDVALTPLQNRKVFAHGFNIRSIPEAELEVDASGNFLIHSFKTLPTETITLNFEKAVTISMSNRQSGSVRYQCMVIGAQASIDPVSKGEVAKIGKVRSFYFYYTQVLRPCVNTIDIETLATFDPLLGGFTAIPDGTEMSGHDVGPDIYFTQVPIHISNQRSGELKFRSTLQGVRYRCKFQQIGGEQEGGFSDCPGKFSYSSLVDGSYALLVRSYNELGTGLSIATAIFTIDTQIPSDDFSVEVSSIVEGSGLFTLNLSLTNAPDREYFLCNFNDNAFVKCPEVFKIAHLPTGVHRVTIEPIDQAGNKGKKRYVYLNVGSEPLVITPNDANVSLIIFNTTQKALWNTRTISYQFGSPVSGITFECQIIKDNSVLFKKAGCTSTFSRTLDWDGSYLFHLIAYSPDSEKIGEKIFNFAIDTIPPSTGDWSLSCSNPTIAASGISGMYDVSCSFVTTSVAKFSCRLNGGSLFECTQPFTLSTLPSGGHALTVIAADDAGNTASQEIEMITIP